jgi:hypothetical protein
MCFDDMARHRSLQPGQYTFQNSGTAHNNKLNIAHKLLLHCCSGCSRGLQTLNLPGSVPKSYFCAFMLLCTSLPQ